MGIERDQTDSERRADEEAKELAFQQAYVCDCNGCTLLVLWRTAFL